ncbi:HlyD family type I secretion periplasmic adaptor subunit [Luminiphilus sp. nBUS_16]|uniref:HlyD family type I secretion periplasmic adaptor subunit n=1 Tax=Luminiphilus sp. nBUS_16 TaxID=3395315 RepID=UPI003EBED33A
MRTKIGSFLQAARATFLGQNVEVLLDDDDRDILDSDRQARWFGYTVVLVVFGGFGIWSAVAPIESAAQGVGVVEVEGHRKLVQHLEGGIVAEIMVANGDYVTKGQPLVRMDATQTQAELSITAGRLWAKRALVDRLLSERDASPYITFTEWLTELEDERVLVAVGNERALFDARRADLLGEKEVLEQQIAQTLSQVDGVQAVLRAKRSIAESLDNEAGELKLLLAEGYVDKQRIRELDRSRASTLGEISDLTARISAGEVAVDEIKLQILQLEKRFKTEVIDSLTLAEEKLYDLQQSYAVLNDRVERTVLKAPASGFVLALKPNNVGAVIAAGASLMSIVPDNERLLIDTRLAPIDIDRIRIGQEAEVRFSVFKDAYSITGELVKVSADSLLDEITGQPYFEAKVRLLEVDMQLLGEYRLVPGMPAEVLIKTGQRTLLGYLTSPLHRMFEKSLIEG